MANSVKSLLRMVGLTVTVGLFSSFSLPHQLAEQTVETIFYEDWEEAGVLTSSPSSEYPLLQQLQIDLPAETLTFLFPSLDERSWITTCWQCPEEYDPSYEDEYPADVQAMREFHRKGFTLTHDRDYWDSGDSSFDCMVLPATESLSELERNEVGYRTWLWACNTIDCHRRFAAYCYHNGEISYEQCMDVMTDPMPSLTEFLDGEWTDFYTVVEKWQREEDYGEHGCVKFRHYSHYQEADWSDYEVHLIRTPTRSIVFWSDLSNTEENRFQEIIDSFQRFDRG